MRKLLDRINADDNRRIDSKDAFDVFRLLQAVDTMALVDEISLLAITEVSAAGYPPPRNRRSRPGPQGR